VSDYDDDNIEFDFFEESAPESEPPRRGLPRRPRRPDGPTRPPTRPGGGFMPLLRLLGLIFGAIAIVMLVVEIGGCSSTSDAYKSYLTKVKPIATASQAQGKALSGVLAQSSLTEASLEQTLGGLVTKADQLIEQAQGVNPPGPLRAQHEDLIDSLKLRRAALAGLLTTFKRTAKEKKDTSLGPLLTEQTQRLAASDVVWQDLFATATATALAQHGVRGVVPPSSAFLAASNVDATSLGNLWSRIHGSAVSSGVVRGTALEWVKFNDGTNTTLLDPNNPTTVRATASMSFIVAVKDTGEVQEPNIKVTVTVNQTPPLDPLHGTIDVINPGETKQVTLPFANATPQFGSLKVDVHVTPVPNEARLDNNTHQYTVVFQV
jgi:hypothetical protein